MIAIPDWPRDNILPLASVLQAASYDLRGTGPWGSSMFE